MRTTLCFIGAYLLFIACSMALPETDAGPAAVQSETQTTSPRATEADAPVVAEADPTDIAPQKPVDGSESSLLETDSVETANRPIHDGEDEPAVE